jgi:hypothetical protein
MNGIIIDSRSIIPEITTASGWAVKNYVDKQISLVNSLNLPYIIETPGGNLVGYFLLTVSIDGQKCSLFNYQFRKPFINNKNELLQIISNFIKSNQWQNDFLY